MKVSEKIEKATGAGQGFGGSAKSKAVNTATPVAPVVDSAKDHALQFMNAAQSNISAQLQCKAEFLQGMDEMLDKAAVAIATAEQDILTGVSLERKLAVLRSEYTQGAIQDAAVSVEFEVLNTLESIAKPQGFPSIESALRCIAPADKIRLDQAVLTSAK